MLRCNAVVAMAFMMTISDMYIPSASMCLELRCSTCRLQDIWLDQRISYLKYSSDTRSSHLVCNPKESKDMMHHLA